MVDYSAALPQQQYFQAPDLMQNAMRMQQMQANTLTMQELARKRSEETALRGITADPSSSDYIQQVARISPELGLKALAAQRQNVANDRAAEASALQAQKTKQELGKAYLDMGDDAYTRAQTRLAAVPIGDASSYAKWLSEYGPAYKGVDLPDPNHWAQDTNGQLKSHMVATSQSVRESLTPKQATVGGVETMLTPATGRAAEIGITPFDATVRPATVAMNPDRLAAMQATQGRLNLPLMQSNAAGANAAVNNMSGAVPTQPPVGNAMLGGPAQPPAGAPSPYGAPISSSMFARQQGIEADAQNLEKERNLEIMKRDVAANAPPAAMNATQERAMLNTVSKDRSSAETTVSTMGDVLKAVKDVQDLSEGQKNSITGITSKLPSLTAESRTAQTKLNNLKGIVTQMGKRSASLGGALGNMAVQEWKIVADGIASLDVSNMNAKDLNDQLDIIAAKANAAAARTKDAYERQYEDLNAKHKGRFALSGNAEAAPDTNAPAGERPPLSSFGGR